MLVELEKFSKKNQQKYSSDYINNRKDADRDFILPFIEYIDVISVCNKIVSKQKKQKNLVSSGLGWVGEKWNNFWQNPSVEEEGEVGISDQEVVDIAGRIADSASCYRKEYQKIEEDQNRIREDLRRIAKQDEAAIKELEEGNQSMAKEMEEKLREGSQSMAKEMEEKLREGSQSMAKEMEEKLREGSQNRKREMEEKLEEKLKEERQNREREIEKMKAQFIELMKEAIKGSQEASTGQQQGAQASGTQFDQQYDPNTQPISRSRLSSSGGSNNDRPGPSKNQRKLNIELLNILSAYSGEEDVYVARLKKFLEKNGKSEDLTTVLNCKRGESGFTILHAVSSMSPDEGCDRTVDLLLKAGADPKAGVHPDIQDIEGRAALHYAAGISCGEAIELLVEKGAKRDILDKQGKTRYKLRLMMIATMMMLQSTFALIIKKRLKEELYNVVYKHKDSSDYIVKLTKGLKEFLHKYKGNQDLEVVLNTLGEVEVKVLLHAANYFGSSQAATEVENLLSEAGATTILKGPVESYSPKSRSLWSNLIPSQQRKLREIFGKVSQAQDIDQLEKVVDEAIKSGVRFNFSQQISPDETIGKWGRKYNLLDCIIARISELGKNPKVASDIVCKLVSKGAVLHNSSSIDVINTLESEFKDHKTNMKKAYEEYVNNTLEFMKLLKMQLMVR
ncbi:ANK_REP_REGION domain-containing protein [Trichonephila clavata]|uniref:ANK_REP_REGION domain-containing protein n=1 Tax=Trichonephila clavata TaxID=2740835 RepID=A0A8X6LPP0_TRICU|nr:ANK_REP_REGION domain-containing protein [Trichonephila clavata]